MFPSIHIYNVNLYSFNICAALAIVCGILTFLRDSRTVFSPSEQDTLLAIIGLDIPIIFAGAMIFNKAVSSVSIYDLFDKMFQYTGMAFIGGFLCGITGFCLLFMIIMRNPKKLVLTLNTASPAIIVGHIIGRLGCLFGGCCYGKPFRWGVVFKEGTPAFSKYGEIPLIPTQLIEIFCLCIIFVVAKKFSKNKFADYIVLYSIQRFFIEFLRGDDRGNGFLMFSPTQTVCIAMIAFILIYGIIKRTRKVILSVWQG